MDILLTADPEIPVPPEHYGGIERIVNLLALGLRGLGHRVGLASHPESECAVDALYVWPGAKSQSVRDTVANTWALWKASRDFAPDIVHSFSRAAYLSLLSARLPKLMCYQREPGARGVKVARLLSRDTVQFSGCSRYISELGRSRGGGRWHSVHNFVDTKALAFNPQVADDAPLVFLSRVEFIKGAHIAVNVAKAAGRSLIIAGNHGESGSDGDYWEQVIKPHIGRDRIEYVGPVNDAQKSELLASAAALLVPIQWHEPFGIVFAEALSCGTPVISCPRGALPEIITNDKLGVLSTHQDDLVRAATDTGQFDRKRCRDVAQELFSIDAGVQAYLDVYQQILEH